MTCEKCGLRIHKDNRLGICSRSTCKAARQRRYKEQNPSAVLSHHMKHRRGITLGQWQALFVAQGGSCYLCERPLNPVRPCVDHDHSCCPGERSCGLCVRGLACHNCNVAIGMVGDDPDLLMRIAKNLKARKPEVEIVG